MNCLTRGAIAVVLFCAFCGGAAARGDDRLACIGSLAMGHAYNTYAYIGTVHDLYRTERYTKEQVTATMSRIVRLCDFSVQYLKDVKKGGVDADDSQAIDELVGIYSMLREEATALDAYGKSRDPKQLERYKQTRADLLPKIRTVLGSPMDKKD